MAEKATKTTNPTVKQSVIAVSVLVIICLICGILLAVCNEIFYISPEERFNRTMQEIYPDFDSDDEYNNSFKLDGPFSSSTGEILSVKKSKDGAYVFESQGQGGYAGKITLYVVLKDITVDGETALGIYSWAISAHNGETLLSNIDTNWYINKFVKDYPFSLNDYKVTGTTMSSSAINNAINMVCSYCIYLGLASNDMADAQEAVKVLLADNGYNYDSVDSLTAVQDVVGTTLDGAADALTYLFVSTGDKGAVYAYVYGEGDTRKIVAVTETQVLMSNCEKTDDFYNLIVSKPIREVDVTDSIKLYTFLAGSETMDGAIVYTVVGLKGSGYVPGNYTLIVSIANGEVTDIEIDADGWVDPMGYAPDAIQENANKLATELRGATLDNFDSKYEDGKVTGATQSANIIAAAVKAALLDYDAQFASND